MRRFAVVSRILHDSEHGNDGSADGTKRPPEDIIPGLLLRNETAKGPTTDDSEDDEHLKNSESLAPLVQEEHIDDISSPQNRRNHPEQAREEAGDSEGDEIILTSHLPGPDLHEEGDDQTEEDDRAPAEDSCPGSNEERASDPPCQRGGDGVEEVLLGLVVGGDLQHEGELVGVGRHLARETGEAYGEEDDDLLAEGPVLQQHPAIEVSHTCARNRLVMNLPDTTR